MIKDNDHLIKRNGEYSGNDYPSDSSSGGEEEIYGNLTTGEKCSCTSLVCWNSKANKRKKRKRSRIIRYVEQHCTGRKCLAFFVLYWILMIVLMSYMYKLFRRTHDYEIKNVISIKATSIGKGDDNLQNKQESIIQNDVYMSNQIHMVQENVPSAMDKQLHEKRLREITNAPSKKNDDGIERKNEPDIASIAPKNENERRSQNWWNEFIRKRKERASVNDESIPKQCNLNEIDLVYTWVDGSSPSHLQAQKKFIPKSVFDEDIDLGDRIKVKQKNVSFRFRDYGLEASTLLYSLKSVMKNMNWVNKIFIITADEAQKPSWWITVENNKNINPFYLWMLKKVIWIHHKDIFINREDLPTFNSCAIESNLHRIPGLSECYIYMNDDFFVLKPLSTSYFYSQDEQLPYALFDGQRAPRLGKDTWQKKVANVGRILQMNLGIPWDEIYTVGHHGMFFSKSVMIDLENKLQSDFKRTISERWRTEESVWPSFAFSNYFAWRYPSAPVKVVTTYYIRLVSVPSDIKLERYPSSPISVLQRALVDLKRNRSLWDFLCVNDLLMEDPSQDVSNELHNFFEELFGV